MIGQSAIAFQEKVERCEQKIVGVNCYQAAADPKNVRTERPDPAKNERAPIAVSWPLRLHVRDRQCGAPCQGWREPQTRKRPMSFAAVVEAAAAGVTHGGNSCMSAERTGIRESVKFAA